MFLLVPCNLETVTKAPFKKTLYKIKLGVLVRIFALSGIVGLHLGMMLTFEVSDFQQISLLCLIPLLPHWEGRLVEAVVCSLPPQGQHEAPGRADHGPRKEETPVGVSFFQREPWLSNHRKMLFLWSSTTGTTGLKTLAPRPQTLLGSEPEVKTSARNKVVVLGRRPLTSWGIFSTRTCGKRGLEERLWQWLEWCFCLTAVGIVSVTFVLASCTVDDTKDTAGIKYVKEKLKWTKRWKMFAPSPYCKHTHRLVLLEGKVGQPDGCSSSTNATCSATSEKTFRMDVMLGS